MSKTNAKLLGAVAGIIVGIILLIFGFWKVMLILLVGAVGWYVAIASLLFIPEEYVKT